ncbi:hypothetical protein O181_093642 [Austropuccinia psidii MF-1]|uniref:Uncharacterized protein n=1 Tax=Austropuccinia psidii MF-1 TaxID=1389203 RepID=A0A9Q3PAP5_9BASI|nr:hypothetical protein [Austropuccinia psidii MF-1]
MWRRTIKCHEKQVHRVMLHTEYINALEEVVTRTKIGMKWKNLDIKRPKKKKEPSKTNNTNEQRKCHKYGGIGLLANNCLKKEKEKVSEIVQRTDHNEKE